MFDTTNDFEKVEEILERKKKKIKMDSPSLSFKKELNIFSCVDALNMTVDQILISSFSLLPLSSSSSSSLPLHHELNISHPFYSQIFNKNCNLKVLSLNDFLFMNNALKKHLGYIGENDKKLLEGGEVVLVDDSEKLHCSVKLYNSKNESIFKIFIKNECYHNNKYLI